MARHLSELARNLHLLFEDINSALTEAKPISTDDPAADGLGSLQTLIPEEVRPPGDPTHWNLELLTELDRFFERMNNPVNAGRHLATFAAGLELEVGVERQAIASYDRMAPGGSK